MVQKYRLIIPWSSNDDKTFGLLAIISLVWHHLYNLVQFEFGMSVRFISCAQYIHGNISALDRKNCTLKIFSPKKGLFCLIIFAYNQYTTIVGKVRKQIKINVGKVQENPLLYIFLYFGCLTHSKQKAGKRSNDHILLKANKYNPNIYFVIRKTNLYKRFVSFSKAKKFDKGYLHTCKQSKSIFSLCFTTVRTYIYDKSIEICFEIKKKN